MHVHKLKQSETGARPIERKAFEKATQKDYPWYQRDETNKGRQYSMCPACENPIRIIGLYKPLQNTDRPYGRHTGKPVKGFPHYDPEAYEWCPYVKKRRSTDGSGKKKKVEGLPLKILATVIEQFDRIIRILRKDTGIAISANLARKMLNEYLAAEGYRYTGATLRNVPWIFAYRSEVQNLFGQHIADNDDLKSAIAAKAAHVQIGDKGQISNDGTFCLISWRFINHNISVRDNEVVESIQFNVGKDADSEAMDPAKVIFSKHIPFDPPRFERLLNTPEARAKRDSHLLTIAREEIAARPALLDQLKLHGHLKEEK